MGLFSGLKDAAEDVFDGLSGGFDQLGGVLDYSSPTSFLGDMGGFPWGSALSAGANLLGGMSANESNKKLAKQQMKFQERMSSTAYQRAVKDMQAAGLNPMLAYSQGGASSPIGAMPKMENVAASAVNSGQSGALIAAQLDNIKAQTERTEAEADNVRADTVVKEEQVPWYKQSTLTSSYQAGMFASQSSVNHQMMQKVAKEVDFVVSQTELSQAQRNKVYEEVANLISEGDRIRADIALKRIELVLLKYEVPGAKNIAEYAAKTGLLDPALGSVGRAAGAARDVGRSFRR